MTSFYKYILVIVLFTGQYHAVLGQGCGTGLNMGTISPNDSWQFIGINSIGSRPYWSFSALQGDVFGFKTCTGSTDNTYLYIYNSNWQLETFNNDNGPYCTGNKASLNFTCTIPGTYYVFLARSTCGTLQYNSQLQYNKTCSAPSTPSTNLNISQPNLASMNLSWTKGNGSHVLIVAKEGSSASDPTNGSTYTANTVFGSGASVGGGFAVYNGTGNSVTVNGLVPGTTYYYSVYEYNSASNCYNLTELVGSAIANTCTSPSTPPSGFTSNLNRGQSLNIGWTRGNGNKVLVIARPNVSPTDPWCGTSYSANTAYGSGDPVGGGFAIYNGSGNSVSVTGLSPDIIYYFSIYEYNEAQLCYNLNELSGSAGFNASMPSQVINVYRPSYTQTLTISGKVFIDNNGDGQSISDAGYGGVQINLWSGTGVYQNTTYSDISGIFSFLYMVPGDYYIEVITPANHQITFANQGNDATDSDIDGSNGPQRSASFTVSGADYTTLGAGYYACAGGALGNINGELWYDGTTNHIKDSYENGMNGVRVNLWRNHFGNWTIWDDMFTGQKPGTPSDDGFYYFTCVPPGEYYINSTYSGLSYVNPNVGGNEAIDSDIDGTNGPGTTPTFTITSGQIANNISGGYLPAPTVSALTCGSAVFTPTTILADGSSYTGTMTVPYTGGNGAVYSAGAAINSTGVTGLTATLRAGTLNSGAGNLIYDITGTPSGAGTATFALSFGGQSCNVTKSVIVSCGNITLEMNDSYGDGWNDFELELFLDGSTLGTYTLVSGSADNIIIPIMSGGTLDVVVNNLGSYENEVSYYIYTPSGGTWYSGTSPHSLGTANSAAIACP